MKRLAIPLIGLIAIIPALTPTEHVARAQSPPPLIKQGFGANTVGGTGGTVLTVNTLSDVVDTTALNAADLANSPGPDGKISFVEAMHGGNPFLGSTVVAGPRIIRFNISGNININVQSYNSNRGGIDLERGWPTPSSNYDHLTINGWDAPDMGVAIIGGKTAIRADEIIIRYMRFHNDDQPGSALDGLEIRDADNFIVDHISTGGNDDGDLDIMNSTDGTVQFSILGPCFGGGGTMQLGSGSTRVTLIRNLFYRALSRAPSHETGDADVRNNVIYRNEAGWPSGFEAVTNIVSNNSAIPTHGNYVNNYYKCGPNEEFCNDERFPLYMRPQSDPDDPNSPKAWFSGNIYQHLTGTIMLPVRQEDGMDWGLAGSEFAFAAVDETLTASAAYSAITGDDLVGASLPCRDSIDTTIVENVVNNTTDATDDCHSWAECGGYPDLTAECPNQGGGNGGVKTSGKVRLSGKVTIQGFAGENLFSTGLALLILITGYALWRAGRVRH